MDLNAALFIGISTLAAVITILWLAISGVVKWVANKLEESEARCREDLLREKSTRDSDQERLRKLEADFRDLMKGEINKSAFAAVLVADKIGQMTMSIDDMIEELKLSPRKKEPDTNRATTVMLAALSGPIRQ